MKCGFEVCFHGAFTSKERAKAKEREVGGFIRGRHVGRGDFRYIVMTRKRRPKK